MSTGFVGTPYICQVLTDAGHVQKAYDLLLQKTYPSWLYPVLNGATTIWERWDGWTAENGFQDPGMNSFNHYAYGAIGAWMVENITGIRTDPHHPGFKHVILQPGVGGGFTWARGVYRSPYGQIISHWTVEDCTLTWKVTLPPNTTASAHIPADPELEILEGDLPYGEAAGVRLQERNAECAVVSLESGSYQFIAHLRADRSY
jgi:alpha-L-rhamnosidase